MWLSLLLERPSARGCCEQGPTAVPWAASRPLTRGRGSPWSYQAKALLASRLLGAAVLAEPCRARGCFGFNDKELQ